MAVAFQPLDRGSELGIAIEAAGEEEGGLDASFLQRVRDGFGTFGNLPTG